MAKEIKYPYKSGKIDAFGDEIWVYGPDPYADGEEDDEFDELKNNDTMETENKPVEIEAAIVEQSWEELNVNRVKSLPDYKLNFAEYMLKHDVRPAKMKLAEKQWVKAIKKANEEGLYEIAVMDGSMSAISVQDMLNEADSPVSKDIVRLVKEEHEELKNEHNNIVKANKHEIETIRASIPEISAKEIKIVYTKQELANTIAGMKILAEDATGREKANLEATIAGLEILLEDMPETMEQGGYALYKDGNIISEYY